jgi:hypothetical protein
MPQCQFPVFCYFCVSEKLHRKYSRNWTKQKPKFLFFLKRDRVQDEIEGSQEAATPPHGTGHAQATPGAGVGPWSTSWRRPSAYIFPSTGKPKSPRSISMKHTTSHRHCQSEIGRVQKLFPAPCRRGESPQKAFFITMPTSEVMRE